MTEDIRQKPSAQVASNLSQSDWDQVRETIVMLNLATAQVQYSMTDGDDSIDALTDSFTFMSDGIQNISEAIQSFAKFSDIDPVLHNEVMRQCGDVSGKMQQAIVAFQFYDKLVQRLNHVKNSMSKLTDLMGNQERLHSVEEWKKLQQDIRGAYTMEEDRHLFDAILAGKPIEDVLKQMTQLKLTEHAADDDIELF